MVMMIVKYRFKQSYLQPTSVTLIKTDDDLNTTPKAGELVWA
jgi:hypothetical protein